MPVIINNTEYVVYADGGSRNHGNVKNQHVKPNDKSAYAYLITYAGERLHAHTHGYYGKTNNQMELSGVIQALRYMLANGASRREVTIVSDSRYVDDMINKGRLARWHRQRFLVKRGKKLRANAGLLKLLYALLQRFPHIKFVWTKGHADGKTVNSRGNIFVDHLLNREMDRMG